MSQRSSENSTQFASARRPTAYVVFPEQCGLVWRQQANALAEFTEPRRPPVENQKPVRGDGQLRNADEIQHANENKVAGRLLANVFADERAL